LPAPPGPVSVTNRVDASSASTSSTALSRPTKVSSRTRRAGATPASGARASGISCSSSGVLPQHALVHRGQRRPGIDAELVRQRTPGGREHGERLPLAPPAGQCPQEQFADAFPPWLLPPEVLQCGGHRREVGGGRGAQQSLGPELDRLDPSVLQGGTDLRVEGLTGQVGQHRAAPEGQRPLQGIPSRRRCPVGHGSPAGLGQLTEQQQIALVLHEPQAVCPTHGLDPLGPRVTGVVQRLAPRRHVGLQDARRAGRRSRAPQPVDEEVQAAHLVGPQRQQGEQRTAAGSGGPDGDAVVGDVQRTEHPYPQAVRHPLSLDRQTGMVAHASNGVIAGLERRWSGRRQRRPRREPAIHPRRTS
jgi:hypothetical protein